MVDDEIGTMSVPGVYNGGDIVRGAAMVILAMGDGRKASTTIHRHLMDEDEGEETGSKEEQ